MELFQITAFVLVSASLVALLRQYLPSYALICLTACSVCLVLYLLYMVQPVLEWVRQSARFLDGGSTACVLRAAGIALVAQNAEEICKDAGMSGMAGRMQLAGRCLILLCALPLLEKIMGELIPFLS